MLKKYSDKKKTNELILKNRNLPILLIVERKNG